MKEFDIARRECTMEVTPFSGEADGGVRTRWAATSRGKSNHARMRSICLKCWKSGKITRVAVKGREACCKPLLLELDCELTCRVTAYVECDDVRLNFPSFAVPLQQPHVSWPMKLQYCAFRTQTLLTSPTIFEPRPAELGLGVLRA